MTHLDDEYTPRFSGYRSLMPSRIQNILVVSSLYDAFVLEEDGSLSELIWGQYVGMRLSAPPSVRRVSTVVKARQIIQTEKVDLVLLMTRLGDGDPIQFAQEVKAIDKDLPVMLLAIDPAELAILPKSSELSGIDRVFVWNNDPQILLAIIKLVEDRLNADHDIRYGQVRAILVLEDSPIYYSAFLPIMYRVIMGLTRNLIDAGFNDLHKQLRMRSRAKILLADNYEEGMALYRKYQRSIMGVISDVRFWRNGEMNPDAGFDFVKEVKSEVFDLPVLLQSAEPEVNRPRAYQIGADFLDKNSPALLSDLRHYLQTRLGFGDFIFRMPDMSEVGRAMDVYEFVDKLRSIPIESLIFHAENNHFSNWLVARTEITMADQLRPRKVSDFETHEQVREYILNTIGEVLANKQRGIVATYSPNRPLQAADVTHIGEGSMGGKGRGLAFVQYLADRANYSGNFPDIDLGIPKTLVVGAGEFEIFLNENDLWRFALEETDLSRIARRFTKGRIRNELREGLAQYISLVNTPLAVRSSSLLEDSHLQPFAGLYATYMLPNNANTDATRLERLLQAIKMVWASTFGPNPKSYFKATSHRIEEERMAVVIQQLVGKQHGKYFYPTFSGVGQSFNFYPFGSMEPEEGVAHVAVGLGKTVVDGGKSLRFSPRYPHVLPQFSSPADWLQNSQKSFYALRMDRGAAFVGMDPEENLALLDLQQAEQDHELDLIASVYSADNQVIRDTLSIPGPRVATFSGILKYNEFPLCDVLNNLFELFSHAMGCPVEMEFAVNMNPRPKKPEMKILQLRPQIAKAERESVSIHEQERQHAWCSTKMALGNGIIDTIQDIVYLKPDSFDRVRNAEMIEQIGQINARLVAEKRPYALLGFGRWGSSDPWLGVGVGWADISGAKAMIETSLPDFRVDPSNGTHFFQNITSLGIGYLTIDASRNLGHVNWDWLEKQPAEQETTFLRLLHLPEPTILKIDGSEREAVFLQPGFTLQP